MSTPPPTIRHPLRILVLTTSPSTPLPSLLEGSDHPLTTPYYSTTVPLWHDTISPTPAALETWQTEWRAPEAAEVMQSLGAWIVVVRKPAAGRRRNDGAEEDGGASLDDIRDTLTAIQKVIAHHQDISLDRATAMVDNEPLLLVIGMPQPLRPLLDMSSDEWEDLGLDCGGWQWIDSEAKGKNEFGEKLGLERLQEALEANEWDGGDFSADEVDLENELGLRRGETTVDDIAVERDDVVGIREAILGQDTLEDEDDEGDAQVEELESMMLKMQAIKEKGAGMPEADRKRLAAKTVRDIMETV